MSAPVFAKKEDILSQSLHAVVSAGISIFLFIAGAVIILHSRDFGIAKPPTPDLLSPPIPFTPDPAADGDRILNLKILGSGLILYGAAILSRRPSRTNILDSLKQP